MALFRRGYDRVDKEKENLFKQPALSAGPGHPVASRDGGSAFEQPRPHNT